MSQRDRKDRWTSELDTSYYYTNTKSALIKSAIIWHFNNTYKQANRGCLKQLPQPFSIAVNYYYYYLFSVLFSSLPCSNRLQVYQPVRQENSRQENRRKKKDNHAAPYSRVLHCYSTTT